MMKGEVCLSFILILSVCKFTHADQLYNKTRPPPKCANTEFYCPYDDQCKPRSIRCLLESERSNKSCLNPETHDEEGCRGDLKTGVFEIWDGWCHLLSELPTSVSRSHHKLKHEFVTYRGFTYEYSRKGIAILDINDPNYKYKHKKVTKFTKVGTSKCKMDAPQLSEFFKEWTKKKYNVFTHNCQHFADKLMKILKGHCTSALVMNDTERVELQYFDTEPGFDYDDVNDDVNDDGNTDLGSTGSLRAGDNEDEGTSSGKTIGFVVAGIGIALLAVVAMVVAIVVVPRTKRSEETKALLGNSGLF